MVEIVAEESSVKERRNAYSTGADSLHRDRHQNHSNVAPTMLEPTTASVPVNAGFATALRDHIPAFSTHQPNRSLPLHPPPPLPRRKATGYPVLYAAATPKLSANDNNDLVAMMSKGQDKGVEDGQDDNDHRQRNGDEEPTVPDNSCSDREESHHRDEQHRGPESRNGVIVEASGSKEDSLPPIAGSTANGTISPSPANGLSPNMMPPILLKKIDDNEPSFSSPTSALEALQQIATVASSTVSPGKDSQGERPSHPEPEECRQLHGYCVIGKPGDELAKADPSNPVSPMMSVVACMPPPTTNATGQTKSIEITIPSVPELGIKETRTDRIDLPPELTTSKPYFINYFLDSGKHPGNNVGIPVFLEEAKQQPDPPASDPSNEDVDEVQILETTPSAAVAAKCEGVNAVRSVERKREWLGTRQSMRERFRKMHSMASDARIRVFTSLQGLSKDCPERAELVEAMNDCEQRQSYYAGLMMRLDQVTSQAKFDAFCKELEGERAKFITVQRSQFAEGALLHPPKDARLGYGSVVGWVFSRTRVLVKQLQTTTSVIVEPAATNDSLVTSTTRSRKNTAGSDESVPRTMPASPSNKRAPVQQRSNSSTFMIDELNSRPSVYPLHSRETLQGARALPNSPREALAANFAEHPPPHYHYTQVYGGNGGAVTEVQATEHQPRQYQQAGEEQVVGTTKEDRRPLDLAIKGNSKRPSNAPIGANADEKKKRKRDQTLECISGLMGKFANYW
ncbi:uncharacterized protein LOC106642250 [Copidosoma floridanum]|uniref:uncharacterized protein LOC106642250 n=1 Tax=Copidosoma floridanum TaxID=29053 RepID=UPI0006C944B5|nr:uncharacterized protein LOC106642250 [Copidosoma floridanum]